MAPNRTVTARVQMLDDSIHTYDVKMKSYANVIHQAVMKDLNLLESDYFGIQYQDKHENKIFLDPLKKIKTQIRNINNIVLKFVVKFFPPDPGQLQEEYTRYLFALQIKHDIVQGMLPCNDTTMTVLASYVAQAEFGDWNASDCTDLTYLKDLRLLPPGVTDEGILSKISEQHKAKAGQSPADADLHLLEIVRRLEHYGLRLQKARDQENTEINLAIAHMGVVVFRSNSKINTFNWARIRKLSFKKKRFLIKLKTEANVDNRGANVGDILEFVMISRDACKTFWRHCIEYHAFFRLEIHPDPKPQPKILKRGSTFRYSGKTQKQLHELVRNSNFRRTTFTRASKRKPTTHPGNASWATPTVPTSISVNGSKGDLYHQSIDVVPSPIKVDVEVNGRIFNKSEVSSMNEEGPKPTQESYNETPSSADAAKSWQLQSENLHSSVVLTNESNLPYEKPDSRPDSEVAMKPEYAFKNEESSHSPVHLHSGGVPDDSNTNEPQLSPNLTTTPILTPPTGYMSTRGLKSTSSLSSDSRYPSSQAYFIAKEILTTERTYVKDLDVINTWFKSTIQKDESYNIMPENVANQLFGGTGSLLVIHQQFLVDLEERLSSWEGRGGESSADQRVDDVMLRHMLVLSKYLESLENGESLISALEEIGASDPRFETAYREFELQKVCYLPFNSFLLKPMQRVAHYKTLLDNLLSHCSSHDSSDLEKALKEATMLASATQERLKRAHNIQKMAQLRRDLLGVEQLMKPDRKFVREGSLYKLSRKGFQQRLFFLFSDCLLYTSKGVTSTNQFKVHAELPLQGMIIEINEGESAVPNCFSILSGPKTVIVAAASQEEMDKWLEDFSVAIARAGRDATNYESPLTNSGSMSRLSVQSSEDGDGSMRNSMERLKSPSQQRSNATMHVCWHRNTSVSSSDHLVSLKNQLSGYLLRKFKNSNGWQKLWVVFTNFCLFFYKSHQDDSPLASLPLLGYMINSPTESDGIKKDFVFKLQFKTHVYFFRAESQYTFSRWLQVISSATVTSQRTRLFSRMDSFQ